jgi:glucosamine--fructose-6-phosphate aminotransferase (isomerizing)
VRRVGLGARTLAICNVVVSMATREADGTVYTHAGPEIGVASTKAFTSQLVALHLVALAIGQARGVLTPDAAKTTILGLDQLPLSIEAALQMDSAIEMLAASVHHHRDFLYLGRGVNYPIALEGALKLKEISYVHAEGYPAGEMKHGPIALIDETARRRGGGRRRRVREVLGNIQEAKARGGRVIVVTTASKRDASKASRFTRRGLTVPDAHPLLAAGAVHVPLQLLAYHVAVRAVRRRSAEESGEERDGGVIEVGS